jgi:hypothetical protein
MILKKKQLIPEKNHHVQSGNQIILPKNHLFLGGNEMILKKKQLIPEQNHHGQRRNQLIFFEESSDFGREQDDSME